MPIDWKDSCDREVLLLVETVQLCHDMEQLALYRSSHAMH
jgi:hypothetical protein